MLALLLLMSSTFAGAANAQDASILNGVDRDAVYLGDQFVYSVQVTNAGQAAEPDIGEMDFGAVSLGQSSSSKMAIVQEGGRMRRSIQQSVTFRYALTPNAAGEFTIPAPTVTVDGKTITGKPISVTVVGPDKQHFVQLECEVDKQTIYPLQPFTITLNIAIIKPPGSFADRSPLSIQPRQPVALSVPWLNEEIPDGLQSELSISEILQPLISRSRRGDSDGLQINDFTVESNNAFSFFADRRRGVFLPPSKSTTRQTPDGTDAAYVEYELKRTFIPQRYGEFSFAPSSIKGIFATALKDGAPSGQQIFAVSNPFTVKVSDIPAQGRPDSYVGAIGKFSVDADIAPRQAHVGEPMTLTVMVFGEGTVGDIRPPDINQVPGIAENFRTYEATEKTEGNGRIFTYSLRALNESVEELPAIPVSYFDVEAEQYVPLATTAIPLSITAAKQLATSDIVSNPQATNHTSDLKVSDTGLFANHSGLHTLRATNVSLSRWMTLWIAMIIGYFGFSFGMQRRQRLHADPAMLKRRNAGARAIESLKAVRSAAGSDDRVAPDALSKIVAGLIADFTGHSEAGMTSSDTTTALRQAAIEPELNQRAADFIDQCDAARFGAGATDAAKATKECETLIADLSWELSKR